MGSYCEGNGTIVVCQSGDTVVFGSSNVSVTGTYTGAFRPWIMLLIGIERKLTTGSGGSSCALAVEIEAA